MKPLRNKPLRHNVCGDSILLMRDLNDTQKHCLQKLIHLCMLNGNKTKSNTILHKTLYNLSQYGDAIAFLMNAIENVKPIVEVKKVRVAGSTQLVPCIIAKHRQETLALRWLVEAATKRRKLKRSLKLEHCLVAEIVDASRKVGLVRKKRDELHKLAESNRGFSHYRWW